MGNSGSVWWTVVECTCRILGVSTATVLCAVGVETVHQGEFNSLGIYLITAAAGIMMFELSYFLDALLSMCLPCPPHWQVFILWGKMARVGGFHKFLYYSIMSVVCFLHPVLVWHAIIPGSMLLVTAVFNFILSKKAKTKSSKSLLESNSDQGVTAVCVTERSGSNVTSSFLQAVTGRKGGEIVLADPDQCLDPHDRGASVQAMLELEQRAAPAYTERRRTRWWGKIIWFRGREEPVEREMEEINEAEPDTTSDTAPMITD
ncbi:transmembrane protein 72 [Cyprinodon tularosa]|uniref:Transmembrane protein 72 n=1 Tax=Cyprinodon variegatus TaxID=28743 RepID=A0A3Q2DPD3_CYPVA|nr:PREDICTED: transmembrane protein 72 [Cyprinodon variegatus]XP_038152270.1 transmembrane protein 72 [Cyprinodon tularosa]